MRRFILLSIIVLSFFSCNKKVEANTYNSKNLNERTINLDQILDLEIGQTYLSVYSRIYSQSEHKTLNFTSTISMRNINLKDSIYVTNASYYNTKGDVVRNYLTQPIYIAPLETVEIIINEHDQEGGTGGNFIFDWRIPKNNQSPYFEAVMISTSVQQGLSFTTQGKEL